MDTAPQHPNRHDPGRARKALRYGREKGRRVTIPAEILRAAGVDVDAELTYKTWKGQRGSVLVRFYRA